MQLSGRPYPANHSFHSLKNTNFAIFNRVAKIQKLLSGLWVSYFYVVFFFGFICCYPWLIWWLKIRPDFRRVHRFRSKAARIILFISGIPISIIGKSHIPQNAPVIFCGNHTSSLDILVCAAAVRQQIHFLGKKELGEIPLFGIFFRTMDIPVDRSTKTGSYRAYKKAQESIDSGISLVIYPEGTTSIEAPKMLEFKPGAFKLAIINDIPIVPVVFLDNWRLFHYDKPWSGRPGKSRILFLQPIAPSAEMREDEFAKNVKDLMEQSMMEHNSPLHTD